MSGVTEDPQTAVRHPSCILKIGSHQLVGSSVTPLIYSYGGGANQVAMQIECAKEPGFIEPRFGLDLFQRIFVHEEGRLHRAVVSPTTNGVTGDIVAATSIGKTKHHAPRPVGSRRIGGPQIGSSCSSPAFPPYLSDH